EIGGLNFQVYLGRDSGLHSWTTRTFGVSAPEKLSNILASVHGAPPFGAVVAGSLDLDNLDNVVRIAYHMGLPVDRLLPVRVAAQITAASADRISLTDDGLVLADDWLRLRSQVYTRLMLARADFVGKIMLLYSFVTALEEAVLYPPDWALTDREVLQRLQTCEHADIKATIGRWFLGELWSCTRLMWFRGQPPKFDE